jgi:hypothetical protein
MKEKPTIAGRHDSFAAKTQSRQKALFFGRKYRKH